MREGESFSESTVSSPIAIVSMPNMKKNESDCDATSILHQYHQEELSSQLDQQHEQYENKFRMSSHILDMHVCHVSH